MTVEKLFGMPGQMLSPQQQLAMFEVRPVAPPTRTRNHSGGSTGSYGSTGSCSSYVSERAPPALTPELLYRWSQLQAQAASQVQPQQQQRTKRPTSSTSERTQGHSQVHKNVNTTRYKTEMCRSFEESGHCKYGEKCQFAHGTNEQRNLSRHPKYKTELCRTFHTIGYCPYGPRCHFIHNEDDLKLIEITHMKQSQVLKNVAEQFVQHQHVLSLPTQVSKPHELHCAPMSRPSTLDITSFSMLPLSLGSTIDTPPSSVTDSPPSLSPTSMMSDCDVFSTSSGVPTPPPGFNSPPALSNVFNFHNPPAKLVAPVPQVAPQMAPQMAAPRAPTRTEAFYPMSSSSLNVNVANLAASLQMVSLNPTNSGSTAVLKDCLEDLLSGPLTPPMSADDFRLPIFSQLVGTNH